jgi:ABC-type transport system involved in cytochrome c biogenesis permease subunit
MKRAFPILGILTAILLSYALYMALIGAPTEQTMGNVQRIFYYHVPSALIGFMLFFVNFGASVLYLIKRNPVADIVALVAAEVGVVFLTVNLVTGPIWARPVWGIWWTWDMRLTSTLVLWLIFFCAASPPAERRPRLPPPWPFSAPCACRSFTSRSGSSAPSIPSRSWVEADRSTRACCTCCS